MQEIDPEHFMEQLTSQIDKILEIQKDLEDARLATLCEENEFIVNNHGVRQQLQEALPEGAKIWVDRAVHPNCLLIVKKIALHPELVAIKYEDDFYGGFTMKDYDVVIKDLQKTGSKLSDEGNKEIGNKLCLAAIDLEDLWTQYKAMQKELWNLKGLNGV